MKFGLQCLKQNNEKQFHSGHSVANNTNSVYIKFKHLSILLTTSVFVCTVVMFYKHKRAYDTQQRIKYSNILLNFNSYKFRD